MKYFYIKKEDNNFSDVLSDAIVKKTVSSKIILQGILILGFKDNTEESIVSYFLLKFGEFVVNESSIITDYSPIPYVDYVPKNPCKLLN